VPKSWKPHALGDIAVVIPSNVDKHFVPAELPVRLCNYLDVYRNRRLTMSMTFDAGTARPQEIARYSLRKGDVIITKDSETPDDIGIPALVAEDLPNTICGYHLAILRPKSQLDSRFLLHYLQTDTAKKHFLRLSHGVTRFALGLRAISSLNFSLPGPDEQAAIAYTLDAVDATSERIRAAIERAKEAKLAILQSFFYSALGETAYADKPRVKLPLGWSLTPTSSLLQEDPKNGVSPEASSQPPGIPTFSIAAIRDGRIQLSCGEHLKYVRIPEEISQRYLLRKGDVLIVRGNANPDLVGKAGIVDTFPEGCIYPDITKRVVFRSEGDPFITPAYAVLAWNHPVVHNLVLRRAKTSNGTLKINNRDVKQIILPVPPPEDQRRIVDLVAAVDQKIDMLTSVANANRELKKTLANDLMKGTVCIDTALLKEKIAS
jgi:type I restriction enzyme S subunit